VRGKSSPVGALPALRPVDLADIYEAELDYVWHTLRRLGIAGADLEDIAHEVFLIVHRRLGDIRPDLPIRPWLFGIAMRIAKDYRRSARVRRERLESSPPEQVDSGATPSVQLLDGERRAMVCRALDALDFDQRVVFVLHEIEERSMPEIAEVVDAPLNTLYSRLRLARKAFADEIRRLQIVRGGA
jgi:RNA polymerase sigma-70 factor (ECF subfamily)